MLSIFPISLLVFLSVTLLVMVVGSPRRQLIRARLEQYALPQDLTDFDRAMITPLLEKLAQLAAGWLLAVVRRFTPDNVVSEIAAKLHRAGDPMGLTASNFVMIRGAVLVGLPAAYGIYLWMSGVRQLSMVQLTLLLGALYLGMKLPNWWLDRKVRERQRAINRALPDALDFIVICVEAGLAFESSLGRVVERVRGPLAEEMRRTLGEISLGKRRRDALRDLAARTQAADLVSFVAAVVQADQTGISIGDVLRIQADDLRLKRRQRAEREGREAPLKLLIPMIIFVFPSTLLVTVGPAALQIMDYMVNAK